MRIGVDVGSSSVKVAAFDDDGNLLGGVSRPLPSLVVDGSRVTQPIEAIAEAATTALAELRGTFHGAESITLTTQRDTLVLLDSSGDPVIDLVSWRDARATAEETIWDALEREGVLARVAKVRSLAGFLAERWIGTATESQASVSRHLHLDSLVALSRRRPAIDVPKSVTLGTAVGRIDGVPLHLSAGDKNCELLGLGVTGAERSGVSLGTAISLGVSVVVPATEAALYVSPAALADRWNVETGIVSGMSAQDLWSRWFGADDEADPMPRYDGELVCVPTFSGAIDGRARHGAIVGLRESTTPAEVRNAWRIGVACELARLAPTIEVATGTRIATLVVSGGGATRFGPILADVLQRPVKVATDGFRGARGAAGSTLAAAAPERLGAFLAGGDRALGPEIRPSALAGEVVSLRVRYDRIVEALGRA